MPLSLPGVAAAVEHANKNASRHFHPGLKGINRDWLPNAQKNESCHIPRHHSKVNPRPEIPGPRSMDAHGSDWWKDRSPRLSTGDLSPAIVEHPVVSPGGYNRVIQPGGRLPVICSGVGKPSGRRKGQRRYLGPRTIFMVRPSSLGGCSTLANSEALSEIRSSSSLPRSVKVISRPLKTTVTLTLFRFSMNF